MRKVNWNRIAPSIVLMTVLFASLACGSNTTSQLASAVAPTATTANAIVNNLNKTAQPTTVAKASPTPVAEQATSVPAKLATTATSTSIPEPTATAKPTDMPPTPTPKPEEVKLVSFGFGQDDRRIGFGFVVENPNAGMAVEYTQYQIGIYDAEGTVLKTESGYIDVLFPSQKAGIGGEDILDAGQTAAKIEVQLSSGKASAFDPVDSFKVLTPTYTSDSMGAYAAGIISSPYSKSVTNMLVSALAYDADGNIVGGGYTYLNFIPAQAATGVHMSLTVAKDKKVAKVDLFPLPTILSAVGQDAPPADATPVKLVKTGYGQQQRYVGYGFLVTNENAGYAVEDSKYRVSFYDAGGAVLQVEEGYLNLLLPGQTLGVGGDTILGDKDKIARADLQFLSGKYTKSDALPGFTSEKVTYKGGGYWPKVTGQIVNPYTKDITNLLVSALTFDKDGNITGGGYGFLAFAPKGSKAAVDVSVHGLPQPASAEIYGTVSVLSNIKP